MRLPPELHYEIWEVLAPHASCDREATDWTDEIWNLLKEHLEDQDEEYPPVRPRMFLRVPAPRPRREAVVSLLDRYNHFEDLTLDTLYAYGEKYTAQDYMDLQRAVIQAVDAIRSGELEAGLRYLTEEYDTIERTILQDEYDEENRDR